MATADDQLSRETLKRQSIRGVSLTAGAQLAQALLRTVSVVVLARLLTPHDYGIVAMVTSITALALLFQGMGLSAAAIQERKLTHEQSSTLFWLNAAAGSALTLGVAASAPLIAWFYQEPQVLWVAVVSALNFVIASLGIQHTALLKRRMQFKVLAARQVTSVTLGTVTSIVCAVIGLSYWSLVFGSLVTTATSTALLWSVAKWKPGPPRRNTGARALVRFGAHLTGFELTNYLVKNLDNVLIGRFWGSDALGIYSKAYSLLLLPINNLLRPLNEVALPALSQLQDLPQRYRQYYRRYVSVLAVTSMPFIALLFVCSDEVVLLLLGPQWTAASGIFQILAFSAFIRPIAATRGMVMVTTGNAARHFHWGLLNGGITVIAFCIGIAWGPHGIAVAFGIVSYAMLLPSFTTCYKGTPVRLADVLESIARPAVASIAAAAVTLWFRSSMSAPADVVPLLLSSTFIFAVSFCVVFVSMPGGIAQVQEYVSFRRYFVRSPAERTAVARAGS